MANKPRYADDDPTGKLDVLKCVSMQQGYTLLCRCVTCGSEVRIAESVYNRRDRSHPRCKACCPTKTFPKKERHVAPKMSDEDLTGHRFGVWLIEREMDSEGGYAGWFGARLYAARCILCGHRTNRPIRASSPNRRDLECPKCGGWPISPGRRNVLRKR